jgi:hypothetical protein
MKHEFLSFVIRLICMSLVFSVSACRRESSSGFRGEVQALLSETGAKFTALSCFGGWIERKMYCEFKVGKDEVSKLAEGLGLDQKLPYSEGTRLVRIHNDAPPCDATPRKELEHNFGIQQWIPVRHGFASSILIYNEDSETACLLLSIAYG